MAVQGPALPVLPATPPGGARCGPDAEARIRRRRGPRTGWPVPQAGCGCTQTSPEASSSRTGARRKPPPPEHALCGLEMAAYRAASEVVFLLFAVCYFSLKGKPESLGVARAVTQTPTHHIQMQCGASPTHCKAHVQAPSKYARSTRRSVLCLSPLPRLTSGKESAASGAPTGSEPFMPEEEDDGADYAVREPDCYARLRSSSDFPIRPRGLSGARRGSARRRLPQIRGWR